MSRDSRVGADGSAPSSSKEESAEPSANFHQIVTDGLTDASDGSTLQSNSNRDFVKDFQGKKANSIHIDSPERNPSPSVESSTIQIQDPTTQDKVEIHRLNSLVETQKLQIDALTNKLRHAENALAVQLNSSLLFSDDVRPLEATNSDENLQYRQRDNIQSQEELAIASSCAEQTTPVARSDAEVQGQAQRAEDLNTEVASTEAVQAELLSCLSELRGIQAQLTERTDQLKHARSQLQTQAKEIQRVNAQLTERTDQLQLAQTQLQTRTEEHPHIENQLAESASAFQRAEARLTDSSNECRCIQEERLDHTCQFFTTNAHLRNCTNQLHQARAIINRQEGQIDRHRREMERCNFGRVLYFTPDQQRYIDGFFYHVQSEHLALRISSQREIREARASQAMAERRAEAAERCSEELVRNRCQQSLLTMNLLERVQAQAPQTITISQVVIHQASDNNSANEAAVNINFNG